MFCLLSWDAQTGAITPLGEGGRYFQALAIAKHGVYYAKDHDLYYYDYAKGKRHPPHQQKALRIISPGQT